MFIGICGVQSTADFVELEKRAGAVKGTGYFLMAGIKRSMWPEQPIIRRPEVRPFIHCDFSEGMTMEVYERQLHGLLAQGQSYIRGVQLNVLPWMEYDLRQLWIRTKQRYPKLTLILQAHQRLMDEHTPRAIADRLRDLPIDYVLFDPSQSRGISYDIEAMRPYVAAVYDHPTRGVIVAGGLSGVTVGRLFRPLIRQYPRLSCDAFAGLQRSSQTPGLDWRRADAYLDAWRRCAPAPGAGSHLNRHVLERRDVRIVSRHLL